MYTYIIKSGDLYKIGRTKNIETRLCTYHLHNPQAELVGYIKGDKEKMIHSHLQSKHVGREWFRLTEFDLCLIIESARELNKWCEPALLKNKTVVPVVVEVPDEKNIVD